MLTNVVVRVYQADITSEDADAVVVSTRLNFNLTCFDGVEEAVARKAGQSYVNERRQKLLRLAEQNNQPQEENEVVYIDGGPLFKARFIVLTVKPYLEDAGNVNVRYKFLFQTFSNILRYVNQTLNVTSISMPALGAGNVMIYLKKRETCFLFVLCVSRYTRSYRNIYKPL